MKKVSQRLFLKRLCLANKSSNIIYLGSIVLIFLITSTSCINRKSNSSYKSIAAGLAAENKELKGKLDAEIKKNKDAAHQKNLSKEIDSSSLVKIVSFLDSSSKQADNDVQEPENLNTKQKIAFGEKLKVALNKNLNNVKIISETLSLNTFVRFKTGALFKPGGYVIEDDSWKQALNAFTPVMDSIINFILRHPNTKFEASIAILGFSDASPIGKGGALEKMLTAKLNNPDADKATLNRELSQIRADAVAAIFEDLAAIKICKNNLNKNINLNIFSIGKGEELADPALAGTPDNDERRRSVIAYWNVIPK